MMRVLVTGSAGVSGRVVVEELRRTGHEVWPFDLSDGLDVCDEQAVARAVTGVEAVVHLAAVNEGDAPPSGIMGTNLGGTWNVLSAAADHGVSRVIFASSVNALGVFRGRRAPDYFPIDDDHPAYGTSAYGASKHLGEELCAMVSRTTGMTTVCLRIPWVLVPGNYPPSGPRRRWPGRRGTGGRWEYGLFIDVRDVASAVRCAVEGGFHGHARLLIAADDALGTDAPLVIADEVHPQVEWRDRERFEVDARLPLVDTSRARETLGWAPTHLWTDNAPRRSGGRGWWRHDV